MRGTFVQVTLNWW